MRSLVLALLVVLVACARPAPPPLSPRPPPPASPPALADLRAGTSGDYRPFSQWTDGHATGFAPELLRAFAGAERRALTWTRFRWPGLVEDLRAGRFDVAADGITVRPERSMVGRFTVPIARGGAVLLLRRPAWAPPAQGATATLAAVDRPRLRVVVNQGGHLERVARALLHEADLRAIADNDAVRAVFARGEADAAMTNTFEAPLWAAGVPGVEQVGPLTHDVTALWVRTDQAEVADRLDEWLLDEEERGTLAALRTRWLGPGAGPRAATPVSALLAATSERLALMPFVAAATRRTDKPVEDAAQEARVIAASSDAVAHAATSRGSTPPPRPLVEGFFRTQIEAAKAVQRRSLAAPGERSFSLEADLRPAIARISARMARLIVRLPRGIPRAEIIAQARVDLASSGLDPEPIERLAAALAALGDR